MRGLPALLAVAAGAALLPVRAGSGSPAAASLIAPLSVRQAGMGGVSTGGADLLEAWSNPALLAGQGRQSELAATGSSMFGGGQMQAGLGGGRIVAPGWAVAALAGMSGVTAEEVDAAGNPAGSNLSRRLLAGGLVAAFKSGALAFGLGVKGVRDEVASDGATAVAADAGGTATWRGWAAGVAVRNLGTGLRTGESLPVEVRGGLSFRHPGWKVRAAVEGFSVRGAGTSAAVGAEWWPTPLLGLRAGAPVTGGSRSVSPTFGLSAAWRGLGLDYAVVTHPLGLSHLVGVSTSFGPAPGELERRRKREACQSPFSKRLQGGKLAIAVAPLAPQNLPEDQAAIVSEMLRVALVNAGGFTVVEKQNMDEILKEQQFQQYGCTEEQCAVRMGRLLNVQAMFIGSLGLSDGKYVLTVRAVDVESGGAVFGEMVTASSSVGMDGPLRRLAAKASRQLVCTAPADAEAEYRTALELYGAGRQAEALAHARAVVDEDPAHWMGWQLVGNCLYAAGDPGGALEAYRHSLELNPDNRQLRDWVGKMQER